MKELGLLELLRYALSGGIGIAVLFLTYPASTCFVTGMDPAKEATLILGSVLLVGTLIYNTHRAMLFPVFLRWVGFLTPGSNFTWGRFFWPWQPSESELEVDHWRWKQPEKKRWDEWGAQTHSLYCSAWAILVALLLGKYLWKAPDHQAWIIFWGLFVLNLRGAVANNFRLLYSIKLEMVRTAHPHARNSSAQT